MRSYRSRIQRGLMAGDRFAQVSNALFRDRRISHKAKGVFGLIASHRDGYGLTIEAILRDSKDGRDAIRSALAELEKFGYLERFQEHDDEGKFAGVVYRITDMPAHLYELYGKNAPTLPSIENARPCSSAPLSGFPTTDNPTSGNPHPKKTNHKKTSCEEEQKDLAPSARSAADVRRTPDGSSARGISSGCAATTETGPVAAEVVEPGTAPGAGKGGSRKASPFPPDVRERIYATERLLPTELRTALAEILPHGHLPNVNRKVTAQALETRDPGELGERAARRWISYGYERDFHDGLLRSPLGAVEELLRPTPYCPDPECEDGVNRLTTRPCTACETRVRQRLTDRKAGRWVPTQRPPRLYRDREHCQVCDRPFRDDAPQGLVCGGCQAELDRAAAHIAPAQDDQADEPAADDPDAAHRAAPPSRAFRQYRHQQTAARTAALTDRPPPL